MEEIEVSLAGPIPAYDAVLFDLHIAEVVRPFETLILWSFEQGDMRDAQVLEELVVPSHVGFLCEVCFDLVEVGSVLTFPIRRKKFGEWCRTLHIIHGRQRPEKRASEFGIISPWSDVDGDVIAHRSFTTVGTSCVMPSFG